MIFAASLSVPYMAYILHSSCSPHATAQQKCGAWTYAMPVCVVFMSSRSGIVFNPSASAVSDHSQSAKDIDPYFKSQLCGGPSPPKAGTNFTDWAEVTGRASTNLILAVGGFERTAS